MSEIPEPQKIIPQYTIRWLLGVTTCWGIVFSIVALAIQGHIWVLGVSVAIGSLAAFMLVCALLFTMVWICSAAGASGKNKSTSDKLPMVDKGNVNSSDNYIDR